MRYARILVVIVAALGGLLLPQIVSPAHASVRTDGVVSDLTWYISRADMDKSIAMMKDEGVKWIRANINWSSIEPNTKGTLDAWWLGEIDYVVAQAHAAGIEILMPIADGVPYWASADPHKSGSSWDKYYRPSNFQDYADFAKKIVARYAPKGVHAYEVWNEPNYSRFWPSGPSAVDYVSMLKAAYPAIKAADPSATVVTGGVSRNDFSFIAAIYAAGGKGYFDAVGVHPYTNTVDPTSCWTDANGKNSIDAFCGIESVHNVMAANGESAKTIWITEFGWSTASGASNGVTEATQASYLTKAFNKLDSYSYVEHAFWYGFRNNYWSNNDQSDIEANYGLTRVDFSTKPSYAAFKTAMGGGGATTTTTAVPTPTTVKVGDTTPPAITGLAAKWVYATSEKLVWNTNEPANSVVQYWKTGGTTMRASTAALVTGHAVKITGLSRTTLYNVRVQSTDAAGNTATSPTITFKTT
ncbi:MAG: polysaccharide biosynthesis protein PslG [Actinomycetota bacterium]